ncbi:DNA phosphorothioation-associated putative methyltransferase [Gemmata massiliana]|uniref:DNA phosphorothioation-associated putative methyltransferase n=1 Tax=Gemmata massiliana TaxID=1210884 RepID=UPI0013A6A84E|nr:DNA phosphorothioation-associated putative methyltransferase [Gemmata massiliana]
MINVIEDVEERAETTRNAWALCCTVLAVSAQVLVGGRGKESVEFGDGVLTSVGTFQRFFEQSELKAYLESVLQVEPIPAGIGTYYLFMDETRRQQLLANRFRRREIVPRRRITELRLEEMRLALEPVTEVIAALGRIPDPSEFPDAAATIEKFGSLKRAYKATLRITGEEGWEAIAQRRREDVLVYLALSRFGKRPILSQLPLSLQRDTKAFFGTYTKACAEADAILFRAGDANAIDEACKRSKIGKLLPDDLYVHWESLDHLEPVLRIYEGCGRSYLGEVEGANIIKIHRHTGKISYLIYPDFEDDPHPALYRCVKLNLRNRQSDCFDYANSANPPILHRKEPFLHAGHELREKFARRTEKEEKNGLLDDPRGIGTRDAWAKRLADRKLALKKHRLVRAEESETIPGPSCSRTTGAGTRGAVGRPEPGPCRTPSGPDEQVRDRVPDRIRVTEQRPQRDRCSCSFRDRRGKVQVPVELIPDPLEHGPGSGAGAPVHQAVRDRVDHAGGSDPVGSPGSGDTYSVAPSGRGTHSSALRCSRRPSDHRRYVRHRGIGFPPRARSTPRP